MSRAPCSKELARRRARAGLEAPVRARAASLSRRIVGRYDAAVLRSGLTGVLAAALAAAPLPCAAAAPAAAPVDAGKLYEQGVAERGAGNFVAAAENFDATYRNLPASDRDIRAGVLFELVDARRNAFAEGEGAPQICEAERQLVGFLDEVKATFGAKGDKRPDTRQAKKVLAEVRKQIAGLRKETPDLDCAREVIAPPPPPEPEPEAPAPAPAPDVPKDSKPDPRPRRLVIAGAATMGAGGLFVIMMAAGLAVGARAERDGAAATTQAALAGTPLSEDDPELQAIVRRGRVGNGLAIAGGILATAALAAGVTLIVLGKRRPAPRAAFAPGFGPGSVGGSLMLRF